MATQHQQKRNNKDRYRPGMNRPMPMKDPAHLPGLVETLIATEPDPDPLFGPIEPLLDLELPELPPPLISPWIVKAIAALSVTLLVFALYGLLGGTL